jgi:hypothetical protein
VGQYLKDHGAVVSAFYVSNVEGYLFQGGDRQGNQNGGAAAFYDNAASLPLDRSTTFIRWVPAFGSFGGAGTPSIRLAPIPSTINDYRSGRLTITEFFPGRGRFARMGRGIGSGAAAGILNRARGSGSGQGPASAIDSVFGSGILTHIALATAAFLAGYFIRDPLLPRRRPGAYYAERIMRWRDAVYRYRLGIPSSKTAAFRLSPEQPLDSFFKSIGFRREFQTGDSAFDARIYIESEDEAVRAALKDNAELRQAILDVFANGARSLWSDGRSIYLESRAEQHDQGLRALELARAEITKTWSKMPAHSRDRFAARPRIARAAVWAVAGYAMASLVDAYLSRETLHLDQFRLIAAGGIAAVGAVLALTGITLVLLRSSSRAHRTLVTIALAALLAAPLFGLQVVSDVNRALDRGSITVTATVSRRWEAGTGGAYYIEMAEPLSDALNPGALRVSRDVFRSVRDGMSVPVVIGEGRLDIPWLRSINGVVVE